VKLEVVTYSLRSGVANAPFRVVEKQNFPRKSIKTLQYFSRTSHFPFLKKSIMNSGLRTFFGLLFIAHLVISVSSAETNTTTAASTSKDVPSSTKVSTSGVEAAVVKSVSSNTTSAQKKPEKGKGSEEECDDNEPEPEPEGAAGKTNATSADRQGKELKLGDQKDKYTWNATAETDPAAENSGNVTHSENKDKLTGSKAAAGSGSIIFSGYHAKCGAILGIAVVYLTACFVL